MYFQATFRGTKANFNSWKTQTSKPLTKKNHNFAWPFIWSIYAGDISDICRISVHQSRDTSSFSLIFWAYVKLCPSKPIWNPLETPKIIRHGFGSKPGTPGEHQNSWFMLVFTPLTLIIIGFDTPIHREFQVQLRTFLISGQPNPGDTGILRRHGTTQRCL